MKTLKNIGIPGPEPSLYNGNTTELHSKVTAAVLFQLFENFMYILFLRCEQDFFSFFVHQGLLNFVWILRARDRDRDILARLRFGHQRPLNRRCPDDLGHQRPVNRGCPQVSKPVSQDIQSICYCLHTGIFRLDTCDLVVAGVRISISPKYLYLYLALKVLTILWMTIRRSMDMYGAIWRGFDPPLLFLMWK